jgi:hypothetical protein
MTQRDRRDASIWLAYHFATAMERADFSAADAAGAAGMSPRNVDYILDSRGKKKERADFPVMTSSGARAAVKWVRAWVSCRPENMGTARACPLCPPGHLLVMECVSGPAPHGPSVAPPKRTKKHGAPEKD